MQLEKFLSVVLPDTGVRFLALNAKKHKPYDNVNDMAAAALAADQQGDAVYFACSAFKQDRYYDESAEKWRSRTQENVLAVRSLWLDIDCGPGKDYPDRHAAIEAVDQFCTEADFPYPIKVTSGRGLHCYWPLERSLPPEKWVGIVQKMRPIYESFGLRFDHSRDCDCASILRVPGTYNRKDPENPLLVEVIDEGDGIVGIAHLVEFIRRNKIEVPTYLKKASLNSDLALPEKEYPPMDAHVLADKCAQIRLFRDTGGGDYNAWRASIGMLKHCVDGEKLVHEWGSKYEGYDRDETQEKYDDWNTAPPTCAAFGNCQNLCAGCPSYGKINSPVTLTLEQSVEPMLPDEMQGEVPVEQIPNNFGLPNGFAMSPERELMVRTPTGEKDENGKDIFVDTLFYPHMIYPVSRIQDMEGVMSMQWVSEYNFMGSKAARTFTIPGKLIGERGAGLHGLLSQYEVVVRGSARRTLEEYMAAWMTKLRAEKEAIRQYKTFGWQITNHTYEGFLLGTTLYTKSGHRQVLTHGKNMALYAAAFDINPQADVGEWTRVIDAMYNHPNHEQFQFVLYAGFGSALIQFLGEDTGAPISLYGGRGTGKTTVAKLATSIYGQPDKLNSTWKTGTTLNGALKTCAIMRSIPFVFDEFSNAGNELSDALYAFGNGKDKVRSDTQGNLKMDGSTWRMSTFLTTNASLHDKVAVMKDDASAEITRILEIHWKNESILDAVTVKNLLRDLEPHYGAPARVFIPWLVENREAVVEIIDKIKERLDDKIGFSKEYRFWSLQLAAALAGGFIATKLGLLHFDWKNIEKFCVELGNQHLDRLAEQITSGVESFHGLLTHFSQQIISTKEEGDARSGAAVEVRIVGEPVGRLILSKGILYLSTAVVRDWCRGRSIGFEQLKTELIEANILLEDGIRFHLGKGTNIATGQVYCWKLNWNVIVGQTAQVARINKLSVA